MITGEYNSALSAARLAANRRNARKSTGPRTRAGKRRAALNSRRHNLCPPDLEHYLKARGEDPREFRRLYRDLVAIFQPHEAAGVRAVELLALTWWEKARRMRNWIGTGPGRCDDLDERVENLLRFLVYVQKQRHEHWQERLIQALGGPLKSPADLRHRIERRLLVFGATRATRKYAHPCASHMPQK